MSAKGELQYGAGVLYVKLYKLTGTHVATQTTGPLLLSHCQTAHSLSLPLPPLRFFFYKRKAYIRWPMNMHAAGQLSYSYRTFPVPKDTHNVFFPPPFFLCVSRLQFN